MKSDFCPKAQRQHIKFGPGTWYPYFEGCDIFHQAQLIGLKMDFGGKKEVAHVKTDDNVIVARHLCLTASFPFIRDE